ncbi:hypothetical protein HGRIS_014099 [Hohenbuehelia grisea]|uniref:Uncharacterized protein n=1 Tax=Hohenbuehelia grisea TaxID=104357 RepID=A0ABR3JTB6_9AGAR
MSSSRWVSGRYPEPGTSPIGDRIRERRGARGLTPLDGTLLHAPAIADGWNALLGAIRTKGALPGDVREIMILRVAARNKAAFEWIHHEPVARQSGVTTQQLQVVRDVDGELHPPLKEDLLTPLQSAALAYADASTTQVKVDAATTQRLLAALENSDTVRLSKEAGTDTTEEFLVEAAAVVATYNMVSRFLVSLDVAGMSDEPVPWPYDRKEIDVPLPAPSPSSGSAQTLRVVTYITSADAPWIVLSNSLMTDYTMWDPLLPYLLAPRKGKQSSNGKPNTFNVLAFDQRGHGRSSLPSPTSSDGRAVTIPLLASDIKTIIEADEVGLKHVHAIIGVSQGGATALAFGRAYPLASRIIACDTGPRTAPGNKEAWEERITLAKGDTGMKILAEQTAARWFPIPDDWPIQRHADGSMDVRVLKKERGRALARTMIERTSVEGFEAGARALQDYDLLSDGLLSCRVPTLLVAGSLDAGGKISKGMSALAQNWNSQLSGSSGAGGGVKFVELEDAGHLPMLDETERFWTAIEPFLNA